MNSLKELRFSFLAPITTNRTLSLTNWDTIMKAQYGKEFFDAQKLENSLCLNSTELYIGGNSLSTEYNYIEITTMNWISMQHLAIL